jgi:hypothetical protein
MALSVDVNRTAIDNSNLLLPFIILHVNTNICIAAEVEMQPV